MNQKWESEIIFNDIIIPDYQIFIKRKNVFGLIPKNPCCQGHVLICSRRIIQKLSSLTQIQTIDLFMTAQEVQKKLSVIYNSQYEMTMQNGKDAGQTVSHCHIHLYPVNEKNSIEGNRKIRSQNQLKKQCEKYKGMFEVGLKE